MTPHYIEKYYDANHEKRKEWLEALTLGIKKLNIDMELYLGNEVYYAENIVSLLENKKASTINNSKYVLFEFPMNATPIGLEDTIYSMLEFKYVPILAHPERYEFVQKNPDIVSDLHDMGILIQSNYGSIVGQYGKKAEIIMGKLLENNLIDFLGTDAHRTGGIYNKVPTAIKRIKAIIDEEEFEKITVKNPNKVLKNEKIEINNSQEPIKLTMKEKRELNKKD